MPSFVETYMVRACDVLLDGTAQMLVSLLKRWH